MWKKQKGTKTPASFRLGRFTSQIAWMSMSTACLSERLVTACLAGDLSAAKAAVADGASVHAKGAVPDALVPRFPLHAAVQSSDFDTVLWLLAQGADPNAEFVMFRAACYSTPAILQLLLDAGGDMNSCIEGVPLLFSVIRWSEHESCHAAMRVLLAQPGLGLDDTPNGFTPERFAQYRGRGCCAVMIAEERARRQALSPAQLRQEQEDASSAAASRLGSYSVTSADMLAGRVVLPKEVKFSCFGTAFYWLPA